MLAVMKSMHDDAATTRNKQFEKFHAQLHIFEHTHAQTTFTLADLHPVDRPSPPDLTTTYHGKIDTNISWRWFELPDWIAKEYRINDIDLKTGYTSIFENCTGKQCPELEEACVFVICHNLIALGMRVCGLLNQPAHPHFTHVSHNTVSTYYFKYTFFDNTIEVPGASLTPGQIYKNIQEHVNWLTTKHKICIPSYITAEFISACKYIDILYDALRYHRQNKNRSGTSHNPATSTNASGGGRSIVRSAVAATSGGDGSIRPRQPQARGWSVVCVPIPISPG